MTLRIQFPRFSDIDYVGYTGVIGEITYDTETDSIVSHDGILEGGRALVNKEIQFDLELTNDRGDFRILDKYSRTLLDGKGRYPVVYPVSKGTSNMDPSEKLIDALPPTDSGHDQYVLALGREEIGDGWGSLYIADRGDSEAPSQETYAKVPIQGDPLNGHWKIVPLAPNPIQNSVISIIKDMDIATTSSGPRIFTIPDKLDRLVLTHIDFMIKDDFGSTVPMDTIYGLGRYVDGGFEMDQTFSIPISGNYTNEEVVTVELNKRKAYANNNAALYLEVNTPSSVNSVISGNVLFRGYYTKY